MNRIVLKYKSPYEEQLNRVRRLRSGIKQFETATNDNFEDAIDAFTSFFIQCYHLRDWLNKSGYSKIQIAPDTFEVGQLELMY